MSSRCDSSSRLNQLILHHVASSRLHADILQRAYPAIYFLFRTLPKKDNDFPNGIILGELELVSRWRCLAAAMRFYVHLDPKHNSGPINY